MKNLDLKEVKTIINNFKNKVAFVSSIEVDSDKSYSMKYDNGILRLINAKCTGILFHDYRLELEVNNEKTMSDLSIKGLDEFAVLINQAMKEQDE